MPAQPVEKQSEGEPSTGIPVVIPVFKPSAWAGETDLRIQIGRFARKTKLVLLCCRFALYKLPKYTRGEDAGLGLQYLYMDALVQDWQLGKYLVNMTQGALGQTLGQLYEAYESKASDV